MKGTKTTTEKRGEISSLNDVEIPASNSRGTWLGELAVFVSALKIGSLPTFIKGLLIAFVIFGYLLYKMGSFSNQPIWLLFIAFLVVAGIMCWDRSRPTQN